MSESLTRELSLKPRGGGDPSRLTFRELGPGDEDYARCEALQHATWGDDFAEVASATMMRLSQKVGGLAAGAFDDRGEIAGCIFGLTGLRDGRPAHWSHLMAVREDVRGLGLGRHLKLFQRDFLLALGVREAYWTYDPLVSRNAHLNLHRLGAEPVEYHEDFYGPGDDNELHRGLGTDRFIVEWRLEDRRVERAIADRPAGTSEPAAWSGAPVANVDGSGTLRDGDFPLPDAAAVKVEVPADIQAVKKERPATAALWRRSTRRALSAYMDRGYRVLDFVGEGAAGGKRYFYVLESAGGDPGGPGR